MKESFWGIFIVTLGIIGISVINVFQTINTTGSHDYYLLKEVTEASMMDAVDLGYYRRHGEIKIIREKFIENFLRRFSESFGRTGNREVVFYDINELPPKVSIGLDVGIDTQIYDFEEVDFNIANNINGILETKFPFEADEVIIEAPNIPGQFTNPKSSTIFEDGDILNVKWGATTSWGTPSSSRNYRLESKCGNGGWGFIANTGTSTSITNKISCLKTTLQYRVRAESDGGISEWRYSEEIKQVIPIDVPPTTFVYTGKVQEYVIPETGTYKLEVWGARGGNDGLSTGGFGGYASGSIHLTAGIKLYVYVGGKGNDIPHGGYNNSAGGWNGGGTGGSKNRWLYGSGGGGATDIRTSTSLGSRIIVAGGGGGADANDYASGIYSIDGKPQQGGHGGGTRATIGNQGYDRHKRVDNGYATQTSGYKLGQGENGGCCSGGGGGGYYGGKSGDSAVSNSSGGSGYVGGVTKGTTNVGVNAGYGKAIISFVQP